MPRTHTHARKDARTPGATVQGRIQDFKLRGGGALKQIGPSGAPPPPPGSAPAVIN